MQDKAKLVRLVGNERRVGSTLADISRHWQNGKESFLFVSPHDDDVALGAGLLIQLAKRENLPVHILIVTDGSTGYCSEEDRDRIADIRRKEALASYRHLGVAKENIVLLGFPDAHIHSYLGRKPAKSDRDLSIKGFTGLQNAFTYYLRRIKPTQCFLPTCNDLHPTHRIVYDEFLISLFHATGYIWPELGKPLATTPHVHEMAIYCDFAIPPTLSITTPISYLEKKLKAIGAFQSQRQISSIIDNIRSCGPEEYLRAIELKLYRSSKYRCMFEGKEKTELISANK